MFLQDFLAKIRFLHILARFYTLKTAENWNQSLRIVYGSIIPKFFLVAQVTHTHQWLDRQNYRQKKCFFGTPYCPVSSSSSRGATLKRNEVVLQRVELGPKSSDQKVSGNFQRGERARVITLSSTFSTCQKKFTFHSNGLNFSWDFRIPATGHIYLDRPLKW